MDTTMKAIEAKGTIDAQGQLHLDEPLVSVSSGRVRIIVLFPEDTAIDEYEWLSAARNNPAFDFLNDPVEDIYTLRDGKPINE
jgi:hypothetical protein